MSCYSGRFRFETARLRHMRICIRLRKTYAVAGTAPIKAVFSVKSLSAVQLFERPYKDSHTYFHPYLNLH
jgi:hypothetical protein